MKQLRDNSSEERSSKRRKVTFYTYKKWMTELDGSFQTMSWLNCDRLTHDIAQFYHNSLISFIVKFERSFILVDSLILF